MSQDTAFIMMKSVFRRCLFIFIVACSFSKVHSKDYFIGAVFEHARQGDDTSDPPQTIVQNNLEYYKRAAGVAKEYYTDIITFPEYGAFFAVNRSDLKPFLERIPNPKEEQVIPCDQKEEYSERPILYSLSCIAKDNQIIVAANMGGIEKCSSDSLCPEDGELQLNANVVFDRNGALLARYYKEHPFLEPGMDFPTEDQDPTFETDIGKFATTPGFEILMKKIADVSRESSIDAVLYSTKWLTYPPLHSATQMWQAWAMGNNITLLAANVNVPGKMSVGSGIFAGRKGAIASTFSPDGISKLIISKIPKRNKNIIPESVIIAIKENSTEIWNTSAETVPSRCSLQALGEPQNIYTDHRCISQNVSYYNLVKLNETQDYITLCNNRMCCELEYVSECLREGFYFGIHNGTHNFENQYFWEEENCFVARCDDVDGKPCSECLMQSDTMFYRINIRANFSTNFIYPSLMASEMRLVPAGDWTYETLDNMASMHFGKKEGVKLLTAGFTTRVYDRDPPYTK